MYHVACHPEGDVSFNITEKLSLNPKFSPSLELRAVFRLVTLATAVFSLKRTIFASQRSCLIITFGGT